jgi:predicted phosphoribosyltransferase
MTFRDRDEAAAELVEKLSAYKGQHPLILAIPRGAVPMGKIVAERLGGELDVVLVHKLGAPGNPEYAIGSIDEAGQVALTGDGKAIASKEYLESEKEAQLETLKKRRAMYTPVRPPIDPNDRVVIIVDDGIATGSTMLAAIQYVRAKHAKKVVVAVPVAARDSLKRVREVADEVICLHSPVLFFAVGQFYENFAQVSDEEVVAFLKK